MVRRTRGVTGRTTARGQGGHGGVAALGPTHCLRPSLPGWSQRARCNNLGLGSLPCGSPWSSLPLHRWTFLLEQSRGPGPPMELNLAGPSFLSPSSLLGSVSQALIETRSR